MILILKNRQKKNWRSGSESVLWWGFPQVCYTYGQDGHNSILCPFKIPEKSASKDDDNINSDHGCSGKPYPNRAKFQR